MILFIYLTSFRTKRWSREANQCGRSCCILAIVNLNNSGEDIGITTPSIQQVATYTQGQIIFRISRNFVTRKPYGCNPIHKRGRTIIDILHCVLWWLCSIFCISVSIQVIALEQTTQQLSTNLSSTKDPAALAAPTIMSLLGYRWIKNSIYYYANCNVDKKSHHNIISRKSDTNPSRSLTHQVKFHPVSPCPPSSNILTDIGYTITAYFLCSKACSYMMEVGEKQLALVWLKDNNYIYLLLHW